MDIDYPAERVFGGLGILFRDIGVTGARDARKTRNQGKSGLSYKPVKRPSRKTLLLIVQVGSGKINSIERTESGFG
jgi:hypothetical protein